MSQRPHTRKPRGAKAPRRKRANASDERDDGDEHHDVLNLRIKDFCAVFGVSERTAWRLIRNGDVEALKVGRSVLITRESALAWRAACPRVQPVKDAEQAS